MLFLPLSYSMDFAIDAEPACTNMNRMLVKSTACAKKIKAIEGISFLEFVSPSTHWRLSFTLGLLTNNKQPEMPKYTKKDIPRTDEVENVPKESLFIRIQKNLMQM